jgi:hypothetical protein
MMDEQDREHEYEEISPELLGYLNDLADTLNLIGDSIMAGVDPKIPALIKIAADLAFEQGELSKIYDEFELEDIEEQLLFLGKEKEGTGQSEDWTDDVEEWVNNQD